MAIERWHPLAALPDRDHFRTLQGELNRLFDSVLGRRPTAGNGSRTWRPLADVFETNDDLVLCFEIPGVTEKDISLSITGDQVTVTGERQFGDPSMDQEHCHIEGSYGRFERSIELPMSVQSDRATAFYGDGVLKLRLPKADGARPKEIKIAVER